MEKELFDILDEELEDELAFNHRQKVVTRITRRIMEWLDNYMDLEELNDFGDESSLDFLTEDLRIKNYISKEY